MRKLPQVLVVEDEPAIAELISVNLRHNGFAVVVASDGASAQSEMDAVLPDLVLLDWMLPGESGASLARHAQATAYQWCPHHHADCSDRGDGQGAGS